MSNPPSYPFRKGGIFIFISPHIRKGIVTFPLFFKEGEGEITE